MIRVKIIVDIYPTEDIRKVYQAVANLFNIQLAQKEELKDTLKTLVIFSGSKDLLNKFKIKIRQRGSQEILRLLLERNKMMTKTYVFLNKQAAFAGNIAFCEHPSESPLGPIRLEIEADEENEIKYIITWLTVVGKYSEIEDFY